MNREFPSVKPEPTSTAYIHAQNENCTSYRHTTCPECGEKAIEREDPGGRITVACRPCKIGKRLLKRKSNYGKSWDEVREWVLERDNHTCQECGATSCELHVHHLENLVWFKTTKDAHNPSNLQTLCEDCHEYGF
jgi:5-methylcytosine-specific restriction endonuclease McrA